MNTVSDFAVLANDPSGLVYLLVPVDGTENDPDGPVHIQPVIEVGADGLPVGPGATEATLASMLVVMNDLLTREDAAFVHVQDTPLGVWTITHGLGLHPAVVVVDSGGTQVFGTVDYPSINQVVVTFTNAFGGKAYLR